MLPASLHGALMNAVKHFYIFAVKGFDTTGLDNTRDGRYIHGDKRSIMLGVCGGVAAKRNALS